jgi:hypothetical protein
MSLQSVTVWGRGAYLRQEAHDFLVMELRSLQYLQLKHADVSSCLIAGTLQ